MKICETREFPGGMGGGHLRVRVTECETVPEGGTRVADDTALVPDWTPAGGVSVRPYAEPDPQ